MPGTVLSILYTFFHLILTVNGPVVKLMSLSSRSSPLSPALWCWNWGSANHISALPAASCLALPTGPIEGGCKPEGGRRDLLLLVCFLFSCLPSNTSSSWQWSSFQQHSQIQFVVFSTLTEPASSCPLRDPSALLRGVSPNPEGTLLKFLNYSNFRSFPCFLSQPQGGSYLFLLLS